MIKRIFNISLKKFRMRFFIPRNLNQKYFSNINNVNRDKLVNEKVIELLDNSKCEGCGSIIQFEKENEEGYINYDYFSKVIEKNMFLKEDFDKDMNNLVKKIYKKKINLKNINNFNGNLDILNNDIKDIENSTYYEDLYKIEKKEKSIICKRCILLKNNNLEEAKAIKTNLLLIPQESLIQSIFKRIPANSKVCIILDCINIRGGLNKFQIEKIKEKSLDPIFVVNKADILPKNTNYGFLKNNARNQINEMDQYFSNITNEKIFITSTINGYGIYKWLYYLKDEAEKSKSKKKYFFIGNVNVGKSSIINKIFDIQKSNKNKSKYEDPFDKKIKNLIKDIDNTDLTFEKKVELTTSILPGTTLYQQKIKIPGIKSNFYDTPGILNQNNISSVISEIKELKSSTLKKQINRIKVLMKPGFSLIIGGLIRIDHTFGKEFYLISNFSSKVSYHVTSTFKVDDVIKKHYGTLFYPTYDKEYDENIFKSEEIIIDFDTNKKLNEKEIKISNLGFLNFNSIYSYSHKVTLDLFLHNSLNIDINKSIVSKLNLKNIPQFRRKIINNK